MSVRIYVEGGGDHRNTLIACRRAFSELFGRIIAGTAARRPKVIASGTRRAAFNDFCNALTTHGEDLILLLVDSEVPVTHGLDQGWKQVEGSDQWPRPGNVTAEQIHLMVQCMEAWFLADKETLAEYYGEQFLRNSLPERQNVEEIPKNDVMRALKLASRQTQKGEYHKTRHGFDILERIDHRKVHQASVWARRLFELLIRETGRNGPA